MGEKEKVDNNSVEVADDKIEADRESETKKLVPSVKTDEAQTEKTQTHEKEEITNQAEDEDLKKETLPSTSIETSSSEDSASKEKPSDNVVEIVTEGKPAEEGV